MKNQYVVICYSLNDVKLVGMYYNFKDALEIMKTDLKKLIVHYLRGTVQDKNYFASHIIANGQQNNAETMCYIDQNMIIGTCLRITIDTHTGVALFESGLCNDYPLTTTWKIKPLKVINRVNSHCTRKVTGYVTTSIHNGCQRPYVLRVHSSYDEAFEFMREEIKQELTYYFSDTIGSELWADHIVNVATLYGSATAANVSKKNPNIILTVNKERGYGYIINNETCEITWKIYHNVTAMVNSDGEYESLVIPKFKKVRNVK